MKIKYALIILLSIVVCIFCFGCNEKTDAGGADTRKEVCDTIAKHFGLAK